MPPPLPPSFVYFIVFFCQTLHKVWYCSQACQKAHWRFHKKFCGGKNSEAGVALAKRLV